MSRLNHRVLGAFIGGMILFYNIPNILGLVGIGGDAVLVARVAIVLLTLGIAAFAWRRQRNEPPAVVAFPVDDHGTAPSAQRVEVPILIEDEPRSVDRRLT